MSLAPIVLHYRTEFLKRYGHRLNDTHRRALATIVHCRTEHYGTLSWHFDACDQDRQLYRSCGHRSCPQCQNRDNTLWLERQQQKLLPVDYFLVTFTLPAQLRGVAWHNQQAVYSLLFDSAVSTCPDFAQTDKQLRGQIGQCAILHTHTRKLDYHPHIHLMIPAGAVDTKHRLWRTKKMFLFAHRALAKVFRAKILKGLSEQRLLPKQTLPKTWVVDVRCVGSDLPALKYLSRYLYRGVIGAKQLVGDNGQSVTFSYTDGQSGQQKTRTVDGPHFVWLILQHVLPSGFRRVHDYGFLHGNAKQTRLLVQWVLRVPSFVAIVQRTSGIACRHCQATMRFTGVLPRAVISGYG